MTQWLFMKQLLVKTALSAALIAGALSGCGLLSGANGDSKAADTPEEQATQEQAEEELEITPGMILKEKEAEPGAGAPTSRRSKQDDRDEDKPKARD